MSDMAFRLKNPMNRAWRASLAALLFLSALAFLQGCKTNDEVDNPWATPAPGEGTMLPSSLLRE